jgi:uncharacterized repeat protein (TIGR03803 family)
MLKLNKGFRGYLNARLVISQEEKFVSRIRSLGTLSVGLLVSILILVAAPGIWAQSKYRVLHTFTLGRDGTEPVAGLIFDQAGNLYGTTTRGGASNSGTVFKLTPNADGGWRESVLYSFCSLMNCSDGAEPFGALIFDAAGNLYGTTVSGSGGGVVFKLTPNPDGSWSESVLYTFASSQDGLYPACGLIFDQAGNLYGTTTQGGTAYYHGTVFKLTPNPDGSWTENVLHSFTGRNGSFPDAGVIFDRFGNLYGTTANGGNRAGQCSGTGCGVVFELTPNPNGIWTESVLHEFTGGKDGGHSNSGLIFDQKGNLYGTATIAGNLDQCKRTFRSGCGVVFQLTPNTDGRWSESVLHTFSGGKRGSNPSASLTFDQGGNLYGTTVNGGVPGLCPLKVGCGVVFKLAPNANRGWSETVLHRFYDHPGANPLAGVIFDATGNLYGTTLGDGGTTTLGSVFEITPSSLRSPPLN